MTTEIRYAELTVGTKSAKYLTRESLARRFGIDPRNGLLDHFHAAERAQAGKLTVRLFLNDPTLTFERLKAYSEMQKLHGLQRVAEYRKLSAKFGENWDFSIRGRK
jgi:hypothetical protein